MRPSSSFFSVLWKIFLFLALQALSILMVVKSGEVQHYLLFEKLRNVQYSLWNASSGIRNYINLKNANRDYFLLNMKLYDDNYTLKRELKRITTDNNIRAHFRDKSFEFIWANVIKNSFNNTHSYLIIDKGANDGVSREMGVILPNGVVGIVMKVGENYSYVESFLNINQNISAKISSEGVFGTMSANPENYRSAILRDIPQHIKIKNYDTVYTSGQSTIFPADIPLGVVKGAKVVNGTHQAIDVDLFMSFNNLEYVIVVKNLNKKEIDSLILAK